MIRKLIVAGLIFTSFSAFGQKALKSKIDNSLKVCIEQSKRMGNVLKEMPESFPRTTGKDGEFVTSKSDWWCSGFFPGTLWYLYEYSKDSELLSLAEMMTQRVEKERYTTNHHDLGFMMYCSFGNGLRITGKPDYKDVLVQSSKSLATRFNNKTGLIKSWDWNKKWKYPVIIDNMMNLEMFFWASKETGDPIYRNMAISHANKTMANHFRKDYSCYHVVNYNPETGEADLKITWQGYKDESSWARGQAWALYGYTMCYRETKDKKYLEQARNVAKYILNHPNMPKDGVPYWDFYAPNIPNAKRDASAGALMASALIELSDYVGKKESKHYMKEATKIVETLSSPEYLAPVGDNANFILKHSVGSFPHNSEVDVPLTYADYYYVEALLRLKKKLK